VAFYFLEINEELRCYIKQREKKQKQKIYLKEKNMQQRFGDS